MILVVQLESALHANRDATVEWLLDQPGIDIDQFGRYESPLAAAVRGARTRQAGTDRWVDRPLAAGADTRWANEFGQSALTECIRFFPERTDWMTRFITPETLEARGEANWEPLALAIAGDSVTAYRTLVAHGAKPARPPTLLAARQGAVKVLAWLLDNGTDIELRGADGRSALYEAATFDKPDVVRLLLDRGASFGSTHAFGRPFAFILALPPTPAMAELLVERGMDLTARDAHGASVADECREMREAAAGTVVATKLTGMLAWLEAPAA